MSSQQQKQPCPPPPQLQQQQVKQPCQPPPQEPCIPKTKEPCLPKVPEPCHPKVPEPCQPKVPEPCHPKVPEPCPSTVTPAPAQQKTKQKIILFLILFSIIKPEVCIVDCALLDWILYSGSERKVTTAQVVELMPRRQTDTENINRIL
ncbi:hypothetical protein H8959_011850 [Pygathrix nigripes]